MTKLHSYLSKSRHGVYYFRWELPKRFPIDARKWIKISLQTKCSNEATELVRYLSFASLHLKHNKKLLSMRHEDLRKSVHKYFSSILDQVLERFKRDGVPQDFKQQQVYWAKWYDQDAALDDFYLHDHFIKYDAFKTASGISQEAWQENIDMIKGEMRKGYREHLNGLISLAENLDGYNFVLPSSKATTSKTNVSVEQKSSIALEQCIDLYLSENKKVGNWHKRTFSKKEATFDLLIEIFGKDKPMHEVDKSHAQRVKQILLELPTNRSKLKETRDLSITDAIEVIGVSKISPVTVNDYISIFYSFFEWAVGNGHAEANIFANMRVRKSRKAKTASRMPFSHEALGLILEELLSNRLGLVKKQSHKWATLIGIYTGARLNEVCQLEATDIMKEGDVWYFNITDEGDNNKSLKTEAARRRVPIHSRLIELGLLDYRNEMLKQTSKAKLLFPEYSYSPKHGYGRSLSRWFNEQLTPALSIKSKAHVFHSLRHTLITRLAQAGVAEPIYQSIVGHERKGVTQQAYMKEGYTLVQLKEAIELFEA